MSKDTTPYLWEEFGFDEAESTEALPVADHMTAKDWEQNPRDLSQEQRNFICHGDAFPCI